MKNFKILTFTTIIAISMICFTSCGDKDKSSTNKDNNESSISTTVTTKDNETTNTTTKTPIITSVVSSTTNNSRTSENDRAITTVTTAQEKEDKQNINNKPANKPSSSQKEFNNSNKNENTGNNPTTKQKPQTTTVNTTTTVTPKPSNPKDSGYWKDSEGNEHYFPDYNNQYVQKIYDSGLVDSSVYRGTTIVKTPTGWSVVFIGTGSNPSAPTYNLGFDTCDLDSATTSNLLSKIDSEGESYMNAVASGDLPMVDLDGNGLLSAGEARIVAIFMSGSYNFDGVYTITYKTIR